MANFKSYSQEGNFEKNLQKVPDKVAKMQKQAAEQRQAKISVEQFRAKTAEIYRRAQEQAGIIESDESNANFKLEQQSKEAQIRAVQQNHKIELQNNEVRAAEKAKNFELVKAFSQTALTFTSDILQKQALDRKKAASLAAYTHGFDMQTLKDVNQLNDGLTYSQYQQTDLFRQFKKDGKSDAYIQAVYNDVYKHRGSKRWVENVGILQNHAASYSNRITTFLDNNPNLSADDKLSAINDLRSEFIAETNINGKLVSAEVLGQHVFPTLRKVDAAIQLKLQGERSKQRDKLLDEDTMRGWEVALGPDRSNVEGLHQALSMNPSFEKRTLFANWLTNSIRTGNIDSETGTAIFNHPIEKDGQRIPWSEAFGGTAEAVQIFEQLNTLRRQESTRLKENIEIQKAENNVQLATAINEALADGLYTEVERKQIQARHDEVFGIGQSSPALDELNKYTTDNRAKEQRAKIIESMIASKSFTVERANSMKLTFEERAKYFGFATKQTQILKSPERQIHYDKIDALIEGDKLSKHSLNKDTKNASHIWQKEQLKRQYDTELGKQLLVEPNIKIASDAAFAIVDQEFKKRQETDYVDGAGNYLDYQIFLKTGLKAAQIGQTRYESLLKLKEDNSSPEEIVAVIGEELVMDAYEAVAKPGSVASEQWKQLAQIYGKDPLTMINMLAPIIGKEAIDPSSFELGKLKANMSPIDQFTLDRFQTNERTARTIRRAMGQTNNSPVRSTFSQYRGSVQLPDEVKNDIHFMNGINYLSEKYNVSSEDLLRVISFETGGTFNPAVKNAMGSGATGLIQFMPNTARGLGTTTEALANMSRVEQLQYVDKFFEGKGIEGASFDDLYMAILFPVAVGKADDFVLFGQGATQPGFGAGSAAYSQNSGLDINNDGSITKAEAAAQAK